MNEDSPTCPYCGYPEEDSPPVVCDNLEHPVLG